MSYTLTYSGLTGAPTGAHIHVGAASAAGGVVVPLGGLTAAASGSATGSFTGTDVKAPLTGLDDLLVQMRAGNTYANIHTSANAGGEIRGQIMPK
jgi:hypothetical protein